jgi:hypothetical protein
VWRLRGTYFEVAGLEGVGGAARRGSTLLGPREPPRHPVVGLRLAANLQVGKCLGDRRKYSIAWMIEHDAEVHLILSLRIGVKVTFMLAEGKLTFGFIGGERIGEGAGRGRRGHPPFIIALETSADGRPLQFAPIAAVILIVIAMRDFDLKYQGINVGRQG